MRQSKTIGIVGGGQLGRMLTQAAVKLDFKVVVLNSSDNSPASQVGAQEIIGDLYDQTALEHLAKVTDLITIEIEHLNADALKIIAKNKNIFPRPEVIKLIQDKYNQKIFLHKNGFAVADFRDIKSESEAKEALKYFGNKMLIKAKHGAYDGRGNAVVTNLKELKVALKQFEGRELYAEAFVPFSKELAVMVAMSTEGNIKKFPVTETFHDRNICIETQTPADIGKGITKKVEDLAKMVVRKLNSVGTFGIEMFLTADGKVLVNEIAPRVHNSGHYTIEACKTSQFDQHIRAITGMELGSTEMIVPAAVMINILGERDGETLVTSDTNLENTPDVHIHLYGKSPTKIDRKMGHITATGRTIKEAKDKALKARASIVI